MRLSLLLLLLVALTGIPQSAHAQQSPPLGTDFIFFGDGFNASIQRIGGGLNVVNDPDNPSNRLARFPGGGYANPAFLWDEAIGRSWVANRQRGDTLFFRIWVSPANAAGGNIAKLQLMLLDSQSLNNNGNPNDDDIPFRAVWPIPDTMMVGQWFNMAIPLPRHSTWAAQNAARDDLDVNGNPLPANQRLGRIEKNWYYQGGFNPDGNVFVENPFSPIWQEFDWSKVFSVGFFWDQPGGPAGPVLIDNMYLGTSKTDLSVISQPAAPYAGQISLSSTVPGEVNVSFAQGPSMGYRLYAASNAINATSIADPAQRLFVRSFPFGATDLNATIRVKRAHPALPNPTVHVGVTSISPFGLENTNPQTASIQVEAPSRGYAYTLSESQINTILNNLERGTFSTDGWNLPPAALHRFQKSGATTPFGTVTSTRDINASFAIAFGADPEDPRETIIFLYANVDDANLVFARDDGNGRPVNPEVFRYDNMWFAMGQYLVDPLVGSANDGLTAQDFQMQFVPLVNGAGALTRVFTQVQAGTFAPRPFTGLAAPVVRFKQTGGQRTGFELMTAFLASEWRDALDTSLGVFTRPAANTVAIHPAIFAYEDQYGDPEVFNWYETRSVGVTSERPNVSFFQPGWYEAPYMWEGIAFAGSGVITSTEGDAPIIAAGTVETYPNPASQSVRVRYAVAQAETVTLDVYNVMGQRVLQIEDNTWQPAGSHEVAVPVQGLAPGVYFVRLSTPSQSVVHRFTVVR